MALTDTDVKQVFTGDGSTTTFAIPFSFDSSDTSTVKVYLVDTTADPVTETLQTEGGGNDYTISGTNVVMNTAPTSDEKLVIIRVTPITQVFDNGSTESLDVDGLEEEMDKIVEQVQELDERIDRAVLFRLSTGQSANAITMPEPTADGFLKWNSAADGLENSDAITDQDLFTTDDVTFNSVTISGLTASRPVLTNGAKALSSGQINLASSDYVTGTLAIGNGGTGQTTATAAFDALGPGTTKGDIIVHDGTNHIRLPVGTDNQVLVAASGEASGLQWQSSASSTLTTKGDIFTYSTANARLPVGTDGQVLVADSGETTGLVWTDATALGSDPLTTKGDLFTFDSDAARLAVGTNGQVLVWTDATALGSDPLTTKGDLFTFDSDAARLAVGTNGQVLVADSGEATGLLWQDATALGSDPLTTKGDLFTFDSDAARLAVGTDGQFLVADSGEATGLVWQTLSVDLTADVTGALPIANGGTGQTTQTAAMDALSPTTTKGDLLVDDGTNVVRVAVGTNDQILVADSGEAAGVRWADNTAGGGGGGGGGFTWFNDDGDAPLDQVKYNNKVWTFSDGLAQYLYTTVKVPQTYIAGNQIKMFITHFHEAASATQLLQAQATLIEPGDAFDDTTDQRTTTNTATAGGDKVTIQAELDLTDSSGQINSVAVAAGDLIKVRLSRGTDTSTADVHFIESSTEVTFS